MSWRIKETVWDLDLFSDVMESPLNIAHRHQRKAEALLKSGKFDEAVEHHVAAEKTLRDVVTTCNSAAVLESLKHQREYHIRQQAVVRFKQKRAEAIKTQQEQLKKITFNGLGSILSSPEHEQHKSNLVALQAIRTLWAHEALVNSIIQASKKQSIIEETKLMSRSLDSISKAKVKMANVEKARLDQLRNSNEELRKVLFFLITDFEKIRSENKTLRSSLEELLLDHQKCMLTKDSPTTSGATSGDCKSVGSISELPALAPVQILNYDLSG